MLFLVNQVVAHRQEQGRIGIGDDAHPLRAHFFIGGRNLWVDRQELTTCLFDSFPARVHLMVTHGVLNAVVLVWITADENNQFGMVTQLLPSSLCRIHLHIANHHRHDDLSSTCRIVSGGHGRAAQQIEKPPLQYVGSENTSVRPTTIGAGETPFIAIFFNRVQDGLGREAQRCVPAHLHPFISATQLRLVATLVTVLHPLQVGLAHHRASDAGLIVGTIEHTFGKHCRGHFVARLGLNLNDTALFHRSNQRAIVRGMRHLATERSQGRQLRLLIGLCRKSLEHRR